MTYTVVYDFRLLIQAKLLQSSKVSGVYSDKPAHPEDEGDMPQKNRYCTSDLGLVLDSSLHVLSSDVLSDMFKSN